MIALPPNEVVTHAAKAYPAVFDKLIPAKWQHVEQYAGLPGKQGVGRGEPSRAHGGIEAGDRDDHARGDQCAADRRRRYQTLPASVDGRRVGSGGAEQHTGNAPDGAEQQRFDEELSGPCQTRVTRMASAIT